MKKAPTCQKLPKCNIYIRDALKKNYEIIWDFFPNGG